MKFGKLNKKSAANTAVMTASGVVGAMASDVAVDQIPVANKNVVRGCVAVAGVALAAMVTGTTLEANAARGFGYGVALQQGTKVARTGLDKVLPENVKQDAIAKAALGQPCGCDYSGGQAALAGADMDFELLPQTTESDYEAPLQMSLA